jgi:hypothetical protein
VKHCLQCGRVYPDDSVYCDQDGSLVQPVRKRLPYVIAGVAVALVALAAAAAQAPSFLRDYLSRHVSVQFKSIAMHANPSLGWPPLRPDADVVLTVHNTALLSPALRSVQLQCRVAGQSLATLEWPAAGEDPLTFRSGDTDVQLKLKPRPADLGQVIQSLPDNREVGCSGPVQVSLWSIAVSRQVDVKTQLW